MTTPVRLTLHVLDDRGGVEVVGETGRALGVWANVPLRVRRGGDVHLSTQSSVLPAELGITGTVQLRGRAAMLKDSKRVSNARFQPGLKVEMAVDEVDVAMPSQMEPPPLLPDDELSALGDADDITQLEGEVPQTLTMQMPSEDRSEGAGGMTSVALGAVGLVSDLPPALPADSDEASAWEEEDERVSVAAPAHAQTGGRQSPAQGSPSIKPQSMPASPPGAAVAAAGNEEEEPEPDGLYGSLREMPLLELTQILELSRKTAGIYLRPKDGPNGAVFVSDGRVTFAASDEAEGEEAFFRLTECRRGAFRVRFHHTPEYENIDQSTAYLHLEAHRRLDEANRGAEGPISLFESMDALSELPKPAAKPHANKSKRKKSRSSRTEKKDHRSMKNETTRVALAKDASLFSHFFAEVDDDDAPASR